ncbi:MAG: hypothetical protein PSV35_06185, partial [bacterium]|nr:hypothetical protein [bacterium]
MASPKDAVSPDAPVKAAKEVIITGTFGIYEGSKKHHDIVISTLSEGKANFDPSSLDNTLYEGIQDYLDKKETIKDGYFKQYPPETSPLPNNPTYFRDLLAEYIKTQKHQIEPYKPQDDDIRLKSPEKATIKMEQLLGKQGVALYRLALEEERFSKEYVDAVFVKSRVGVPGEKWDGQRPVVFVAGPSSSGKSVAANAVLAQASQFIKTQPAQEENKKAAENQEAAAAEEEEEEEKFNNYAIFSDGGNERELSQVRKLAIQLAIDNGYTGVKDLETESKVKNKVKSCILNAVENTKTLGIVIPETFSGVVGVTDIIKKFQKDPNNVVMFSRVEGEKPSFFQKIVAYLGARRAFKSSGFDQERDGKLDLNKTGLPESKAYGAGGFKWGKWGSEIAESEFIASKTDTISFIVTNDLILKRYDDKKGQWVDGKEGQNGITLVSNRAFNLWIKENPDSRSIKELEQFNKNNKHTIIHSHGQMDLLKIQIAAERHVAFLQQPKNFNPENLKLRTALEKILEVMPAGLKDGGLKITQ